MNKLSNISEQNPYQSTAIDELSNSSDEIEVELASPWARIGAAVINIILICACFLPLFLLYIPVMISGHGISGNTIYMTIVFCCLLICALLIWQAVWMTQRGQSIGKRIVGIKVVDFEGENPGFVGTVLMREIVYNLIIRTIIFVISIILGFSIVDTFKMVTINTGSAMSLRDLEYVPLIICLIMLFFPQNMRRTLQDYLAKTVVIKA